MIYRKNCPICNIAAETIFSRSYSHKNFRVFREVSESVNLLDGKCFELKECNHCQLIFQSNTLEDTELGKIYSTPTHSSIAHQLENLTLHSYAHLVEEILAIRQIFNKVPTVLDFGCAWGKWASLAQSLGCISRGFEIDPATRKFGESRGVKFISKREMSEERFDFINVDQVAEHLSDPIRVLQELDNSLKVGGLIKISVPGNPTLKKTLKKGKLPDEKLISHEFLDSLAPLSHINLFNNKSLKAIGRKIGWKVYRPSLITLYGCGQLWNIPRQLNRNLLTPIKRFLSTGTYIWFKKVK